MQGLKLDQNQMALCTTSSAWLILQSICSGSFSLWNLCLLRTNTNTCGTNRKQTKGFKSAAPTCVRERSLSRWGEIVKRYNSVKVPGSANNPLLSAHWRVQMDSDQNKNCIVPCLTLVPCPRVNGGPGVRHLPCSRQTWYRFFPAAGIWSSDVITNLGETLLNKSAFPKYLKKKDLPSKHCQFVCTPYYTLILIANTGFLPFSW